MPKLRPPKKTLELRHPLIRAAIKTLITGTPLLFGLTAMERAHATVTIPNTPGQVVLQSPTYGGDNTFIAPPATSIGFGVTGDNSKDWNFTNQGNITTYDNVPTVSLGSATGASVFNNSGRVDYWGNGVGGVSFTNGGTLNNTTSGVITTSMLYAVLAATPITVNNDGLINGSSSGMRITGGVVTQSATGQITSDGGAGILNDGGAITINNNGGSISGAVYGIFLRNNSSGAINNSGTITGTSGAGINIASTGSGTIANSGTITGTGAAGINIAGANNWTITNNGTISGTNGTAINIANTASNINLILQTGSLINGNVTSAGANTKLELQGNGTANNTFSGFSNISVLQSGTSWTLGGTVSTTGSNALVEVQNGQLTIAGTLTNTGGFSISNNGILQITGSMANAGISNIASSGTLMVGNGGTTGSTTGNIVNDGTIIFNRSNNMTLNGVISGSGSIQKLGTNTLAIDGANTYTGLTTIQEGDIYLNNAQGLGTGGVVLNSAAESLIFGTLNSQTASGLFINAISGAGLVAFAPQTNIVLGGNNTHFNGDFYIASTATLSATSAENLGSADIVDNGIFQVDAATDWALTNTLTGTGAFVKSGAGQLLINQLSHSGATTIADGTLLVGSGSSSAMLGLAGSAGLVTVDSGATLSGTGTVNGSVLNQGTIAALNTVDGYEQNAASNLTLNSALDNSTGTINLAGGKVGNTLTVMGDYTGGGTLLLNTKLSDDASLTDKLIIKGNSSGSTSVTIQNKDGNGSQTVAGIKMIEVDGASNGSFDLANRVTIGMYDYNLNKANDGSWYLQSLNFTDPTTPDPLIPEIGVALGNQTAAQFMFVHSMYDRMGDLRNGVATIDHGGWVKVSGGRAEFNAAGDVLSQRIDLSRLQFGTDIAAIETTSGSLQTGIMGGYAHARTKSNSNNNAYTSNYNTTDASGKVDGYTVGAYATWLQKDNAGDNAGLYVDSWLQLGRFRNSINGNNQSDYNSTGISASVETGYRFAVGAIGNMAWSVEPQAQVVFSKLNSNDYTTSNGMSVSDAGGSGTMGRLGVRLSGQDVNTGLSPFAEVNAWFGRNGADSIKFSDAFGEKVVSNDIPNTRIQLKTGLQGNLNKNWQVWGDVGTEMGSNDFTSYQGSLGVRYNW